MRTQLKLKTLLFVLLTLAQNSQAEMKLDGLQVISDLHLYAEDFDYNSISDEKKRAAEMAKGIKNRAAFEKMLQVMAAQKDVTDIILNGDLFHAPTLPHLSAEEKFKRMADLLVQIQRETGKKIHFNFGNHDTLVDKNFNPVPGFVDVFRTEFQAALDREHSRTGKRPSVSVIGWDDARLGDFKAIYDVEVTGRKLKIAHFPFVKTALTQRQAEYFKLSNEGAFGKVTRPKLLESNPDNVYYIQSDSHSPAFDLKNKVFNTGMLTVDVTMPFPDPTFLSLGSRGPELINLGRDPKLPIQKFEVPMSCDSLYRN